MYKLKQIPEDFEVKEILKLKTKPTGNYTYFLLKKKNCNTLDAIDKLAKKLDLEIKRFGFAGNKDKRAVTEQYISVYNIKKEKVLDLRLNNISVEVIGYGDKPISLGILDGNEFKIVVRNLNKRVNRISFLENYFDEQRFSKNNIQIGKSLVKKEFKKACELLALETKNNDYIGALRRVYIKKLRFYVNAFQSYLWNEVVGRYLTKYNHFKIAIISNNLVFLKEKINNFKVSLINFDTDFKDQQIKKLCNRVLKENDINQIDFLIRQIPELITTSVEREVFVKVDWISDEFDADELNQGMKKQVLRFRLPKGSYATLLVKKMFFA